MAKLPNQATLSRAPGRTNWTLRFRHPLRLGPDGRSSLQINRGLGTDDEDLAKRLAHQMNMLLADESMHTPAARDLAVRKKYHPRIVAAFYDDLVPVPHDGWAVRDKLMPLPGLKQNYRRVLLLGSTGSGKTTLLNQLLGVNPRQERFLATSAWRTTTAQFEAILAPGGYEAVATFLPRDQVRRYVEDCLAEAVEDFRKKADPREAERQLMEHDSQRFRLSFLLGRLHLRSAGNSEEDDGEEIVRESASLSGDERDRLAGRLKAHHTHIAELAKTLRKGDDSDRPSLIQSAAFQQAVDEILADVRERCAAFGAGELEWGVEDWPTLWQFAADASQREDFLAACNRLCGNDARDFGQLLTPLVDGVRVSGPFMPTWGGRTVPPQLVLLDGEGIDHKAEAITSVPTAVTRLFDQADVLLLVDAATPPLLTGPQVALRTACYSGHEGKLMVCFTKLDKVEGPDLTGFAARVDRVRATLDNFYASVRESRELGLQTEAALRAALTDRVFFVQKIHEPVTERSRWTLTQLHAMLAAIERVEPPAPIDIVPEYDDSRLVLHVQQALRSFHADWRARLNLPTTSSLRSEHWGRVKALTRHVSELGEDHYDTLRPVADLIAKLAEDIGCFIDAPARWEPTRASPDMRRAAVNKIKNVLFTSLHALASSHLLGRCAGEWRKAYCLKGDDSTKHRARALAALLESAAPQIIDALDSGTGEFHDHLREMILCAIASGGGKMLNVEASVLAGMKP